MNTNIHDYIARSAGQDWQPLVEKGVHYAGVYIKSLRFDCQHMRSPTILLKFDAGAAYPYHNHPAGEELFVLAGKVTIEEAHLTAGDYLYTPPGFRHSVQSDSGCTLLLFVPEEVVIMER